MFNQHDNIGLRFFFLNLNAQIFPAANLTPRMQGEREEHLHGKNIIDSLKY